MSGAKEMAELVVDAIIGATLDALDDLNDCQGRVHDAALESRATAIEVVAKLLTRTPDNGAGS